MNSGVLSSTSIRLPLDSPSAGSSLVRRPVIKCPTLHFRSGDWSNNNSTRGREPERNSYPKGVFYMDIYYWISIISSQQSLAPSHCLFCLLIPFTNGCSGNAFLCTCNFNPSRYCLSTTLTTVNEWSNCVHRSPCNASACFVCWQQIITRGVWIILSKDSTVCHSLVVGLRLVHIDMWILHQIQLSWNNVLFSMFCVYSSNVFMSVKYVLGLMFYVLSQLMVLHPYNYFQYCSWLLEYQQTKFLLQQFFNMSLCRLWKQISSWMTKEYLWI